MICRAALLTFILALTASGQVAFKQVSAGWMGDGMLRADVNNDGIPDLVGYSSALFIMVNNGDGTFQPPRRLAGGNQIWSLSAIDLNRDGNVDLVGCFANSDENSTTGPTIWWGDGKGNFTRSEPLDVVRCQGVAVGDVNGDGIQDVVATYLESDYPSFINGVTVYFNSGSGSFSSVATHSVTSYSATGSCDFWSPVIGDFDKDGKGDLAIGNVCVHGTNADSTIVLGHGDGTGHFAFSTIYNGPEDFSLQKDDVNQDGWLDLLAYGEEDTQNSVTEDRLSLNSGTGWPISWNQQQVSSASTFDGVGDYLRNGTTVDVDGDGIKDFAFPIDHSDNSSSASAFRIMRGAPDGAYQAAMDFALTSGGAGLVAADFDRDGRIDFALQLGGSSTVILLNRTTSAPTCSADQTVRSVTVCSPAKLTGNSLHLLANTTDSDNVTGMKVYIDNTEKFYSPNQLINRVLAVPNGGHRITTTAWDARGSFSSARWINVNTSFGCGAYSTNRSVHLCFPTSNATVGGPTQVVAAVRTSYAYHGAKVYVDGISKFSTSSKQVNANLSLAAGQHRITVQASDSHGTISKTIYATVR